MDGFARASPGRERGPASGSSPRADESRVEDERAGEQGGNGRDRTDGDAPVQDTTFAGRHAENFLGADRADAPASREWRRELDCGLRSFCTPSRPSIHALFKHRFSDFVVHEIAKEGRPVVLSEPLQVGAGDSQTNGPHRDKRASQETEQTETKRRCASAIDASSDSNRADRGACGNDGLPPDPDDSSRRRDALDGYRNKFPSLAGLLSLFENEGVPEKASEEQLVCLFRLADGEDLSEFASETHREGNAWIQGDADGKNALFLDFTGRSKEARTRFHQLVRESTEQLRSETTTVGEGRTAIRVWRGKDKYDRYRRHPRESKCKYTSFVVCKENMDTMEMVHLVARTLGLQPKKVQFAGTKDKRGVTVQRVSVPWVDADRVARLSRLRNIIVGNVEDSNVAIKLGDLTGNKFQVMLREVGVDRVEAAHGDDSSQAESRSLSLELCQSVLDACDFVKKFGFINYFGCQRFGTHVVRTHWVGRLCLLGKWREVIECILAPEERDSSAIREAMKSYDSSAGAKAALSLLPKKMSIERAILRSLAQHPGDYLRAFQSLVRSMRMMYVHAYQSYIWNEAASKRVDAYGISEVVVGDLVVENPETLGGPNSADLEGDGGKLEEEDGKPEEDNGKPENDDGKPESENSSAGPRVLLVDSKEMALRYSIHQVVLPLPGKNVLYPTHQVGEFISDLLALHGLDRSFSADKQFYLGGDYRPLLARPSNFDYAFVAYSSRDQDLVRTAMSRGDSHDLPPDRNYPALKIELEPDCRVFVPAELSSADRPTRAGLYLSFCLPSSCYASCLIREVLRRPLDQATLRSVYRRPES
ncbi:uncharacterized protein LOC126311183 [Schistocerca gregaria]|uniref:uncharacterized protein LOC126311183 n=1 Tax=Schistocerca gregaria TaxID=7010 RepID=UPI00211DD532|nr:uncharacterized protein LOC126311183 [Schistocerca gregaria]